MTTLYLDRRGLELDHQRGMLRVRGDGDGVRDLPLHLIERVVIHGSVQLKASTLGYLADNGISVVLLGGRMSRFNAHVVGPFGGDVIRRAGQYRAMLSPEHRTRWARWLVRSKLRAQRRLILRLLDARPDQRGALHRAIEQLDELARSLRNPVERHAALLGLEGAAAQIHFRALASVMPPSLGFQGRNRRPPKDPVNALLSLGYTLLHAEALHATHVAGLDPYLGGLHTPAWGRPSLACDLMEPLRPRIDELAYELLRTRTLQKSHFSHSEGACLLGKAGRQQFYAAYEQLAPRLRRRVQGLTRALARRFRVLGVEALAEAAIPAPPEGAEP